MHLNPGPSGILIGILQIVAALLALRARLHILPAGGGWPRVRERDGVRVGVAALIALVVILGVLRATGLDFWLRLEGGEIAREGGWYQSRAMLQIPLLGILAVLYAFAMASLRHIDFRKGRARLTGTAMALLIALIHIEALRNISLHQTDAILFIRVGFVTLGVLIEGMLLVTAIVCLVLALRTGPNRPS